MTDKSSWYVVGIVGVVAFAAIITMIIDVSTNDFYVDSDVTGSVANTPSKGSTVACIDTDAGYNYSVKGTVAFTKKSRTTTYTDACIGNILTEYACSRTSVASKNYSCSYGCVNGACSAAPGCSPGWMCVANNTYSAYRLSDCSYVNSTYCQIGCIDGTCIDIPLPPLPPVPTPI